jgi:hypothetical protein
MADKSVTLKIADKFVGAVIFTESPAKLEIHHTPNGTNMVIPAAVELNWKDRDQPCPLLSNLRAVISFENPPGTSTEIGRVWDDTVYFGKASAEKNPDKAELVWTNILPSLGFIEENRNGRLPKLTFEVRGELSYILKVVAATPPQVMRMQPMTYEVLSFPNKFYDTVDVTYPKDVWERLIQAAF